MYHEQTPETCMFVAESVMQFKFKLNAKMSAFSCTEWPNKNLDTHKWT